MKATITMKGTRSQKMPKTMKTTLNIKTTITKKQKEYVINHNEVEITTTVNRQEVKSEQKKIVQNTNYNLRIHLLYPHSHL